MIIQLTGLSGAGKTTIAEKTKEMLRADYSLVEIIDGDAYRKTINKDLGFSRQDREENIRRLGAMAYSFSSNNKIAIIAAINPFESVRKELSEKYGARTVWIKCNLDTLFKRDTKGLYKRTLLPDSDANKLFNLTGVNDVYEVPAAANLVINTTREDAEESANKLYSFIKMNL